jgi:hypothetical protein
MSVRAQWFGDAAGVAAPCAQDQHASDADLTADLSALMEREAELFNCGITCPIRDRPDSICSVCPLSKHHDRLDPLQPLCTVGRQIDRVLTSIAISQAQAPCPS